MLRSLTEEEALIALRRSRGQNRLIALGMLVLFFGGFAVAAIGMYLSP